MHILLVNVFFAPQSYGGATIVAEEVARRLVREAGVRVTAVSAICRPDLQPYATLKAEVDGIVNVMINLPTGRGYAETYCNAQVAQKVAEIADTVGPDLAHLHCLQEIGADTIAALKSLGLPVILSTHDFWWLCERQFMLRADGRYCAQDPISVEDCRGCAADLAAARARSRRLAQLAGLADLVTCPGEFARGLHARSGFAPDRLVVWENGIRLPGASFAGMQAARRDADPRLVFGFVGGPSAIKGWPLLHQAFSALERSDFAGLLVEGSLDGGWWRGRDISDLKGDWRIHPRYSQEEMDGFFAKIDVLLFLSQWKETFGLTVREALARGIRVIQTDSGGTMEHGGGDATRVVPIGCSAERLRREIRGELCSGARGAPPVAVRGHGEQAAEFLSLAERVLGGVSAKGAIVRGAA